MVSREVKRYLSRIGAVGGRRSRRVLSPETARQMVRVREARRAFKTYASSCFWSYDPTYVITSADIPWVVAQLRKYGNRSAWQVAERLCR